MSKIAVQLLDPYEEVLGTVLLKDNVTWDQITDAWDEYLKNNQADTQDFVDVNESLCEMLTVEFYQPNLTK
jgi:hypothetical protein